MKSKTQAGVTTEIKSEIHAQTRIQSLQQIVQVHGYRRLRRTQQPVRQCMGLQGSYASLYPPPRPPPDEAGRPQDARAHRSGPVLAACKGHHGGPGPAAVVLTWLALRREHRQTVEML